MFFVKFVDTVFLKHKFQSIFGDGYLVNNATTSTIESSKFAFRQPLHKLRCNYFCFIIYIVITAHSRSLHFETKSHSNCMPYSLSKMCSAVQLLGNMRSGG